MVFIGPTDCDDNRARRSGVVDELWKGLKIDTKRHVILGNSFDLLREGLSCYQNGACTAAVALCRASVESAVYLAVTRHPKYHPQWGIVRTRVNLEYVDEKWGRILKLAEAAGIVRKSEKAKIQSIREAGNLVLHGTQKVDEAIRRITTAPTKRILPGEWFDEGRARMILRETITVLNRIGDWFSR